MLFSKYLRPSLGEILERNVIMRERDRDTLVHS